MRVLPSAILLSFVFAGVAAAENIPVLKSTQAVTADLKTEEYVLDNGLTVYLTANPKAPNVSVIHWVNAGSLHETPGITGIAHLFEHMMFRPLAAGEDDFSTKLRKLGGDYNANTRFESTVYTTTVPDERLDDVLKLESDRFKKLTVTKELLDTERKAVWSEYSTKMDANPSFDLWYSVYAAGFPNHPFGWMIIGFRADLEKITAEDCNKFFARFYLPNNTGLFISGNIDTKKTIAAVQKYYSEWKKGEPSALPAAYQHDNKYVFKEGLLTSKSLNFLVGYRTPVLNKDNYDLQWVTDRIFFGSDYSLAKRRFVHGQKIASDASDWNFEYDNGMLRLYLTMLPGGNVEQVVQGMAALNDDFNKMTDEDFSAYLAELRIGAAEALQRNKTMNMDMALAWGKNAGPASLNNFITGTKDISKKQVQDFVAEYFKKENMVVVTNKQEKSSH